MQCYECAREGEDTAAWVAIVDRPERFCCLECSRQFVERLSLPIVLGVGTWFVDQVGLFPEGSPPQEALKELTRGGVDPLPSPHPIPNVAIIGVRDQGGAPPVTISTREEYLEYFPYAREEELSELFDRPGVTMIEVQEAPAAPAELYMGDGYARVRRAP